MLMEQISLSVMYVIIVDQVCRVWNNQVINQQIYFKRGNE